MSTHSNTLSWFWAYQSLLLLLTLYCVKPLKVGKEQKSWPNFTEISTCAVTLQNISLTGLTQPHVCGCPMTKTWISNAMHVVFFMLNPQALVSIHGKIDYQCIKYALIVDLPMDRNKCLWLNHMVWVRSVFSLCWYWWNNWLLISMRFDFQRYFLLCISSIALIKLWFLASFLIFADHVLGQFSDIWTGQRP